MQNHRAVKLAVVWIALAFVAGGFMGAIGAAPSDASANVKVGREITPAVIDGATMDLKPVSRDRLQRIFDDQNEELSSQPNPAPESTLFSDSFEDDILGADPDNPPWYTEEVAGADAYFMADSFETGTVGQIPPSPWISVDGASTPLYWQRNYEDTVVDQNLAGAYHAGTDGYFNTFNGDATVLAKTRPAGTPAGAIITEPAGTMASYFNEGVAGDATASYYGPSGVDDSPTSAYCAAWFYLDDTSANWGSSRSVSLIGYDYTNGMTVFQITFYALGETGSTLVAFHGDGLYEYTTGSPVSGRVWHELAVRYYETTETFDVYLDGAVKWTGLTFSYDAANGWYSHNLDSMIIFGGDDTGTYQEPCRAYIDNFQHFVPATGGSHTVRVSDAWSIDWDAGNNSVFLDQNGYAGEVASTQYTTAAPFMWGMAGVDMAIHTSTTVANSNGATIWIKDFTGANAMGFRLSGGNMQYYTAATWVTLQTFAANTDYYIALTCDTNTQQYTSVWIADTEYPLTAPLGQPSGGLATFRLEGTLSTQSELYVDYISFWGANTPSQLDVSADFANTGVQSINMNEMGASTYSAFEGEMTTESFTTGRVGFWFRAEAPFGAQSVYLVDSTGSGTLTIISLGADLTGNNNPSPGELSWVYGDGLGGGWITGGGTFTTGVWHHIEVEYDGVAQTFTPYYDGVPDAGAPYMPLDPVVDAAYFCVYGEAPYGPGNFYYDDITLWADTRPTAVTNFDVDQYGQNTATATYNYVGVTQATNNHYAYLCDVDDATSVELTTPNSQVELTDAQYVQVSSSNNVRAASVDPGNGDEMFVKSQFRIAQTPASILSIEMTMELNGAAATAFQTYAYNQASTTWVQVGTDSPSYGAGVDGTVTNTVTAGSANYISGAGDLLWGIYQIDSSDLVNVDFVQVVVTYVAGGWSPLHNTLNWTLSADDGAGDNDVTGYHIYRKDTSAEPWNATHLIATVGPGIDTYTDMNRGTADSTYWWYVVRAFDAVGEETNINAMQEPGAAVDTTPPTANAGPDQSVGQGTLVTFDGSLSTDNVGIVSYTWTFTDGAPQTLLGVAPTYTFNTPGVYTVTLTCADAASNTGVDTVDITVTNAAPTANAGVDQTGVVNYLATFDGSGSSDPDGTIVSYQWTFTYNAAPQTLLGVSPTFSFQLTGVYTVTLTVTDDDGATAVDTMTVTANYLAHNIDFAAGWNLISFAVNTEGGKPLSTVFADEWSNIQTIQYFDTQTGNWKTYDRSNPAFLNNLKTADESRGYWVKFIGAGDGVLTVTGKALSTTTIQLYAGWNLVGVPDQHSVAAQTVLAGTGFDALQMFDDMSTYLIADMLVTNLMDPGSAYWVHVPAATSYVVTY